VTSAPEDMASETAGVGRYILVYFCILILAALQFMVAYSNLSAYQMLLRLLPLAVLEAILAVLFFMHLLAEKRWFVVSVVVLTLFVLISLQYSWTDSFRLLECGGRCS
jgi:cytochrome c oxidase subunit IV